ncbi:hypothetical protein CLV35_0973 [Motilibacter peucedani]|uniref:Ketoreductase domain-containing protein n=1 Tax=Motilibacter peucedani TaxID=598650 RepID=A0A420XUM2_9ACTN|nr:SDR family oxidoreductase [Motilibacter peucedani]RKS80536.1 hypothetical protein CLV35_0973 [Motilibacter peucedani]
MPTALVTGASSGIGAAFVERLAARGFDLVLVARDAARLEIRAAEVRDAYAVAAEVLPADLSDREQLRLVEVRLSDPERPVDLLVNNAGFSLGADFGESDVRDEERLLDVLVRAVVVLSKAALPGMVERGGGAVINVSSIAGLLPNGTYSAAKAYVTSFTEGLATSLAGTGVRVQALCPGLTHTEFHSRAGLDLRRAPSFVWTTAEQVVDTSLRDLDRGRLVSLPGWTTAVFARVAPLLPRAVLRQVRRS